MTVYKNNFHFMFKNESFLNYAVNLIISIFNRSLEGSTISQTSSNSTLTESYYEISSTSSADAGTYNCSVSYTNINSEVTDTLKVVSLSVSNEAVEVFKNTASSSIVCTAAGAAPDTLQWVSSNGTVIQTTSSDVNSAKVQEGNFVGKQERLTLVLENGQEDETYTCKVAWGPDEFEDYTSLSILG